MDRRNEADWPRFQRRAFNAQLLHGLRDIGKAVEIDAKRSALSRGAQIRDGFAGFRQIVLNAVAVRGWRNPLHLNRACRACDRTGHQRVNLSPFERLKAGERRSCFSHSCATSRTPSR